MLTDDKIETPEDRKWREFWEEIAAQKAGTLQQLLVSREAATNVVSLDRYRRLKKTGV